MRIERNLLIETPDGATLAADLYRPDADGPAPALIGFYPYRKDDIIGSLFEHSRRDLVGRGYAHVLVDCRGYGGSDGDPAEGIDWRTEARDAAHVIEWVAAQTWCTGAVGVWGVSYGGFVPFAVATDPPPALKAIAPVFGLDDIREMLAPGGVPTALGRHARDAMMLAQRLAPPTFQDVDGRWERVWRERLRRHAGDGPALDLPAGRRGDDDYWRAREIPLERIRVPALLIAGWRDVFATAMTDAFARIPSAERLIVGPWRHVLPDLGVEPIDWHEELARFFDRHLRDAAPAPERAALVFVQGAEGGWQRFADWPPPSRPTVLHPATGGSLAGAPAQATERYESVATVGAQAGVSDLLGAVEGYPLDQGPDDRRSLTFTSEPLDGPLLIAGAPELTLDVEAERADVTAKLVDVAPDGGAALITTGWGAARGGGPLAIRLMATAYALPAGHRLRLSLACADFPFAFPLPRHVRLGVRLAGSALRVPAARAGEPYAPARPPEVTDRLPWSRGGRAAWTTTADHLDDALAVTIGGGDHLVTPAGATMVIEFSATAHAADARPQQARVEARTTFAIDLAGGEHVAVSAGLTATRERRVYDATVTLDGRELLARSWWVDDNATDDRSVPGRGRS